MKSKYFSLDQCIEFKLYPVGHGHIWIKVHDIEEIRETFDYSGENKEQTFCTIVIKNSISQASIEGSLLDNTKKIWDLYYDK